MNKSDKIIKARADYIKRMVNQSPNAAQCIRALAKKLYLSERTIDRDLKK